MKIENVDIKIVGNAAVISLPQMDGSRMSKTVSLQTLVKAFQENASGIETPVLPFGAIKYKERGNTSILAVYHEPTSFTARFDGDLSESTQAVYRGGDGICTFENVKRGGIVMVYYLCKNSNGTFSMSDTRCYGIKDHPLTFNDNTECFMVPFPNVGKDNGWVCWGDNRVGGEYRSLCGFRSFADILFNSKFNNDLFDNRILRGFDINHPIDLFVKLQGLESFPDEYLIMPGAPITLGGF
jgi:hypothetical protein